MDSTADLILIFLALLLPASALSFKPGLYPGEILETTDFSYLSLFIWVGLGFIAGFFVYLLKRKGNQPENEVQQIENDWEDFAYSQVTKSNNHLKGLEQFLDQVEFPISNRDLIRHAEKNLTDGRKLNLLERLPDHIYQTKAEILDKLKPLINLSGG